MKLLIQICRIDGGGRERKAISKQLRNKHNKVHAISLFVGVNLTTPEQKTTEIDTITSTFCSRRREKAAVLDDDTIKLGDVMANNVMPLNNVG